MFLLDYLKFVIQVILNSQKVVWTNKGDELWNIAVLSYMWPILPFFLAEWWCGVDVGIIYV
jgi:hypothetical protein